MAFAKAVGDKKGVKSKDRDLQAAEDGNCWHLGVCRSGGLPRLREACPGQG